MTRFLLTLALSLCMLYTPFWLVLILIFAYVCFYDAYELIFCAVCVDAFFGNMYTLPYYTIGVSLILLCVILCKPRFLMYTK
jgi:hypothetical protein